MSVLDHIPNYFNIKIFLFQNIFVSLRLFLLRLYYANSQKEKRKKFRP